MKAGTHRRPYISKAERINRHKTRIEASERSRKELQKFVEEHPEEAVKVMYELHKLKTDHPYLFW